MDIHEIASLVGQVLLVVFGAGSLALAVTLGWSEVKAWKLRRHGQRLLKGLHTPCRVPSVPLRTGPVAIKPGQVGYVPNSRPSHA